MTDCACTYPLLLTVIYKLIRRLLMVFRGLARHELIPGPVEVKLKDAETINFFVSLSSVIT